VPNDPKQSRYRQLCVTKRELINSFEANFRTSLIYRWIHCFWQRRPDEARKAIVTPGELPEFQVPRRRLDHCIDLIKKWFPFISAELIFNLDKTGLSDWEALNPSLFWLQPISAIR
jgi:hypothetical protein